MTALFVCGINSLSAQSVTDVTGTAKATSPTSLCTAGAFSIGFFNGVRTTRAQAQAGLEELSGLLGNTYTDGSKIGYDLYYNHTGVGVKGSGSLEDFIETFTQRAQEDDAVLASRWETFWEIASGETKTDSVIGQLTGSINALVALRDSLNATAKDQAIAALKNLVNTPPTLADYAEHRTRLDTHITQRERIILVAHSQGNLFMNAAYDYASGKVGADSVKAVHVAPASPTLRGPYTLADKDLIIAGLRVFIGNTPQPNVTLSNVGDVTGHGFRETYLNPTLEAYPKIKDQMSTAASAVKIPAGTGSTGFFTVTMTWNGSGDVDLHTFEPGGAHVYYASQSGSAGVLDVDNTLANGPEHYYASCDPTKLQTGTYRIGINNYANALGRTATIQLSSYQDGLLRSVSTDVGPVRGTSGNASPITVFNVVVSKDANGNFSVASP